MSKIIYIDFDGTISDCRRRLYDLFCELSGSLCCSFEEYWNLKCEGLSQKEILTRYFGYTKEKSACFQRKWLEQIEEPIRLRLDKPVKGAREFLIWLGMMGYERVLVTNRQSKEQLLLQLKDYEWLGFFEAVLVTEQKKKKDILIREYEMEHSSSWERKVYIGDMPEDVAYAASIQAEMFVVRNEAKMGRIPLLTEKCKMITDFSDAYRLLS